MSLDVRMGTRGIRPWAFSFTKGPVDLGWIWSMHLQCLGGGRNDGKRRRRKWSERGTGEDERGWERKRERKAEGQGKGEGQG
eukprot:jgi/Botrbrau1/16631/Bobra.0068s0050.1